MQQTEKYKLNLIEPDDAFSPDGLNANTRKVEQAMAAHEKKIADHSAAQDTAIESLVKNVGVTGHNARVVLGSYKGDGQYGQDHPTVINVDFFPVLLFMGYRSGSPFVAVRGWGGISFANSTYGGVGVTFSDHSIRFYNDRYAQEQFNINGTTYAYVIIGYDPEE